MPQWEPISKPTVLLMYSGFLEQYFRPSLSYHLSLRSMLCPFWVTVLHRSYCTNLIFCEVFSNTEIIAKDNYFIFREEILILKGFGSRINIKHHNIYMLTSSRLAFFKWDIHSYTNSADPDQTLQSVASYNVLHCLLKECSIFGWKWKSTTQTPLKLAMKEMNAHSP